MMRDTIILRVVVKLLLPVILIFALYVQFHGDYGPGGGFQAGVIFGAAFILYALIFGLDTKTNLRSFKHSEKDFARHGDAYKFILNHFDKYGEFASPEVLVENFPTLDKTAQSVNFEYAVELFKDQVLQRAVVSTVQQQRELVKENPKTSPLSFPMAKESTSKNNSEVTSGEITVCIATIKNRYVSFLYNVQKPIQFT